MSTGKQCPEIDVPEHGSVLIPCVREFDLTCLKRCSKGFYLDGEQSARCIMQGNQTTWTGKEAVCKGKANVKVIRKIHYNLEF